MQRVILTVSEVLQFQCQCCRPRGQGLILQIPTTGEYRDTLESERGRREAALRCQATSMLTCFCAKSGVLFYHFVGPTVPIDPQAQFCQNSQGNPSNPKLSFTLSSGCSVLGLLSQLLDGCNPGLTSRALLTVFSLLIKWPFLG